jgi:hypothetical protein
MTGDVQTAEQQQTQPITAPPGAEHAALAALTVILLSGLTVPAAAALTIPLLVPLGIPVTSVTAILEMLGPYLQMPGTQHPPGSAQAWVEATAAPRRAAYLLAAARRHAVVPADTEQRWMAQHLAAERARQEAAGRVDTIAGLVGTTIGWYSVMDLRTTAGCREMHGANFEVAQPPTVEGRPAYPGAVHGACRCRPGPPHPAR